MRRLVFSLLGCAVVLGGCSQTTSQQVYDQALIKQVDAGSVALASLAPTPVAQVKTAGEGSSAANQQAATYLVEGRLDKLSASDLVRMATANRNAAARIGGALTKLDQLARSTSGATGQLPLNGCFRRA